MKITLLENSMINILCEFIDGDLEESFIKYDISKAKKYTPLIISIICILYICSTAIVCLFIDQKYLIKFIIINRSALVLLILSGKSQIDSFKNYSNLLKLTVFYEIVSMVSIMTIFSQYSNSYYLLGVIEILMFMIGISIIPNKWLTTSIINLISYVVFLLISLKLYSKINFSILILSSFFLFVGFIMISISSYITNYLKRHQFFRANELLKMSITDPLTGIYNRGKFDTELKYWVDYSKRYKSPLTLVMFDFDEFKSINDKYGHLIGDDVILQSVKLISKSIRHSDVFARWGGEEFVLLLTNTDNALAFDITERIRKMIEENIYDTVGHVTCSFGMVTLSEDEFPVTLMQKVDQQLYYAKSKGKNRVSNRNAMEVALEHSL